MVDIYRYRKVIISIRNKRIKDCRIESTETSNKWREVGVVKSWIELLTMFVELTRWEETKYSLSLFDKRWMCTFWGDFPLLFLVLFVDSFFSILSQLVSIFFFLLWSQSIFLPSNMYNKNNSNDNKRQSQTKPSSKTHVRTHNNVSIAKKDLFLYF